MFKVAEKYAVKLISLACFPGCSSLALNDSASILASEVTEEKLSQPLAT